MIIGIAFNKEKPAKLLSLCSSQALRHEFILLEVVLDEEIDLQHKPSLPFKMLKVLG